MGKLKNNQSGFSAIEGLLVLIVILLVGFIGYYVYNTQKTANKTKTTTSATANTSKKTALKTNTTPPIQSYLTISEWDVKLPISGALATAQYQDITAAYGEQYSTIQVTVTGVSTSDTCKGGLVGWISRIPDNVPGASPQNTISHIGSYNYVYEQGQDCTTSLTSPVIVQFMQAVGKMVSA